MSSIEIDRDKGIYYHCNCVRVLCLNVANVANKAAIAHVRACDLRTNADNVIGSGDTEAGVITQGRVELAGDAGKSLPTISAKPDGVWAGSQPSTSFLTSPWRDVRARLGCHWMAAVRFPCGLRGSARVVHLSSGLFRTRPPTRRSWTSASGVTCITPKATPHSLRRPL